MILRALIYVLKRALEFLRLDAHPWVVRSYAGLARWRARRRRTPDGFRVSWEGLQISLPPQNGVSALQLDMGVYESGTFAVLARLLKPGDCVVDVGANVGVFSLFVARRVGSRGRVIAIEPLPINLHHLERNMAENRARCVTVVAAAVGASCGRLTILMSNIDTGSSSVAARSGTSFEVPMQTVDEIVERHGVTPTWVKIDTEGFEVSVLRGMQRILSAANPPKLLVEVNRRMLALAGHNTRDLFDTLRPTHPYMYAVDERDRALQRIDVEMPPRKPLYNLLASPHEIVTSDSTVDSPE